MNKGGKLETLEYSSLPEFVKAPSGMLVADPRKRSATYVC